MTATTTNSEHSRSRSRPYGLDDRYHLQHVHLFASNIDETINFYKTWFNARVTWDGDYGGARNVFMKIGIGAMHLYEQSPRDLGRNAVHHLGMQVVGLHEVYGRMKAAGLHLPNPVREHSGGGYFMVKAPDNVLLEVFEPGRNRDPRVREYYGLGIDE
ncbi:VOC family protein [Variovorax gossypii]|uniref:VOC family protein n=1 Tax=Variovorax gossypii TaxID=1679495 RepID=A0A3S0QBJ9_9BURK|nr:MULTISPECIES: VOC family protein [Variovorax]MDR6522118.1 putative enzyme related to lactoylglutathione lyase [Variovorax paradoxus]RTQ35582.1 VOC family protein [Variovorax gossypii]